MQLNELEQLTPFAITVIAQGERVDVSPLRARQLLRVLEALEPLLDETIAIVAEYGSITAAAKDVRSGKNLPRWMARARAHLDELIELISAAIEKPHEWGGALTLDEVIELAGAVLEVNLDFFSSRLAPALARQMDRLTLRLAGSTRSTGSPPQATPSPA
jgi:hypothetical protein